MIKILIEQLAELVTELIQAHGAWAVFGLMGLESANIPIPSEVILTYGGFLVSQGKLNFHLVALAGALGCLAGSMLSHWLGLRLGRPFLWRHGKWLLITQQDILWAERFLQKYGSATYFFSRLLPVVRTFIALVIGVSRGNFFKANLYGFLASWIWSYVLVYTGVKLGENWQVLRPWWDRFSFLIIGAILAAAAWHVVRVWRAKAVSVPEQIDDK